MSIEHFICDEKCTLADFKDRVEPIMIDSQTWDMECSVDTPSSIEPILRDPLCMFLFLFLNIVFVIIFSFS